MGYDQDFYNAYKAYLQEPEVRRAHDFVFKITSLNPNFRNVVDFGCGLFNEFYEFAKPFEYIGVDVNMSESKKNKVLVKADYRKTDDLHSLLRTNLPGIYYSPGAFVSLFSTEITAPTDENYKFYNGVFRKIPAIKSGLVSGFYYTSKKHQNPIFETGGVISYQTLENIEEVHSDVFSESRVVLPVPSEMFGKDVFEVWKFFERK